MQDEKSIIQYFIGLLNQIKLFHWATTSFAKHKALDELHSSLSEKVDLFVESYIGKMKLQPLKKFSIETVATSNTASIDKYLEQELTHIKSLRTQFSKTSEFQNVLDEMMSAIDKTMYLLNLS